MRWRTPATLLRDAQEGARVRQKDLRTLESNLPYDHLGAAGQPNRHYPGNAVRTTRYTPLLFLPVNLYEQFHRWANVYFVGLAVLNFVPVVNAFQPEVALIPVCVMMGLTALKDGWEDFRRYQSDRRLNNRPCLVYRRYVYPPPPHCEEGDQGYLVNGLHLSSALSNQWALKALYNTADIHPFTHTFTHRQRSQPRKGRGERQPARREEAG